MTTTYELSNNVTSVALNRFSKTYAESVINAEGSVARQQCAQKLIDYLCKLFKITSVRVTVTDKPRVQRVSARGKSTIHGFYKRCRSMALCIVIYNTTPSTHKEVGGKTFLETLVHEFCHHYDYSYLRLNDSPHTRGFYMRVSDLKYKLTN